MTWWCLTHQVFCHFFMGLEETPNWAWFWLTNYFQCWILFCKWWGEKSPKTSLKYWVHFWIFYSQSSCLSKCDSNTGNEWSILSLKFQYNIFFNNNLYLLKLAYLFSFKCSSYSAQQKMHCKMWYLWQWVYQPACSSDAEPDVSLGAQNIQPHELLYNFSLPPQHQAAPQHPPATFFFPFRVLGERIVFCFFRDKFTSPFLFSS